MERFSHDVIVIGCGAAGLRAAVAVAEAGLDVCILSKAGRGLGTSTIMSRGHFAGAPVGWTREQYRDATLRAGKGLNRSDLTEFLIQDASERLDEIVRWGLQGVMEKGQLYAMGPPPVWGKEIIRCLLDRAIRVGVRFRSGLTVTGIRSSEDGAGILCYSALKGEWVGFSSRALVLATGGAGALYLRHDNPRRMLGEGYVLALEAGATLRDMEFFQFIPISTAVRGLPQFAIPSTIAGRGRLINGKNEELLDKYDIRERPADVYARDRLSQALMYEILAGEPVFLDLRGVSDKEWQEDPLGTAKILCRQFRADREMVPVMPTAHFFMGGICTDADGRTDVPGLFAAGEVTGGLHGANRMAGNALTETLVFGARAGWAASQWASGHSSAVMKDLPEATALLAVKDPGDGNARRATDLKKQLQKVLWERGGIIRKRQGLLEAVEAVDRIREEAGYMPAEASPHEVQKSIELQLGAKTALLILQAALRREESRGAHFREDFPREDNHRWLGYIEVSLVDGKPAWSFKPVAIA
jgi:succinate dehydrogenase/fumarate reductase flavoprotein subunit